MKPSATAAQCVCVYAVHHPREARVIRTPGCPQHPGGTRRRLVGLPPWMRWRGKPGAPGPPAG